LSTRHFYFLAAAVVFILFLVAALQLSGGQAEPPGDLEARPQLGYLAPDFTLRDLEGNQVTLSSLRGKAVFLNFWATWCQYCVEEMPSLQEIHDRYGNRMAVYAINVGESLAQVSGFLKKNGYTFPVLLDEDEAVARRYLIRGFPTSFFIDARGVIVELVPGGMTTEQMEQAVQRALR